MCGVKFNRNILQYDMTKIHIGQAYGFIKVCLRMLIVMLSYF